MDTMLFEDTHFGKLPAEIRNTIYELALHEPSGITVHATGEQMRITGGISIRLTATCRQIRNETKSMFFACNTFTLATNYLGTNKDFLLGEHTAYPLKSEEAEPLRQLMFLPEWVDQVGAENLQLADKIILDLGSATTTVVHTKTLRLRQAWKHVMDTITACGLAQLKLHISLRALTTITVNQSNLQSQIGALTMADNNPQTPELLKIHYVLPVNRQCDWKNLFQSAVKDVIAQQNSLPHPSRHANALIYSAHHIFSSVILTFDPDAVGVEDVLAEMLSKFECYQPSVKPPPKILREVDKLQESTQPRISCARCTKMFAGEGRLLRHLVARDCVWE